MMTVLQLLTSASIPVPVDLPEAVVTGIVFDSRSVQAGNVFVAVRGRQTDGHQYVQAAGEKGAVVIVAQDAAPADWAGPYWISVADSAQALGDLAAAFYSHPSRRLQLIGVTGTNGKTTVATLLFQAFSRLGYTCGLISTVENRIGSLVEPSLYTTPDAVSLQALLARMADAGCSHAFMEVSSHAVDQRRIAGLHFSGGVFTNMSHDHLDYHGTFAAYITAKKQFFDQLPDTAFALVNADDKRGSVMVQNTVADVHYYSLQRMADFHAKIVENNPLGLHLEVAGREVYARMIGEYNASNLLAVYGVGCLLGEDPVELLTVLSELRGAEGRMEVIRGGEGGCTAVVDYAHTPDALDKVLSTLSDLRQGSSKIITVVGCGGDRDKLKRPKMAAIALQHSDEVILTSDNPRSEDPEQILNDMEAGIVAGHSRHLRITDRKLAIRTACKLARTGDIVLIAGKGHEKYQEIRGVRYPFDDVEVVKEALGIP